MKISLLIFNIIIWTHFKTHFRTHSVTSWLYPLKLTNSERPMPSKKRMTIVGIRNGGIRLKKKTKKIIICNFCQTLLPLISFPLGIVHVIRHFDRPMRWRKRMRPFQCPSMIDRNNAFWPNDVEKWRNPPPKLPMPSNLVVKLWQKWKNYFLKLFKRITWTLFANRELPVQNRLEVVVELEVEWHRPLPRKMWMPMQPKCIGRQWREVENRWEKFEQGTLAELLSRNPTRKGAWTIKGITKFSIKIFVKILNI